MDPSAAILAALRSHLIEFARDRDLRIAFTNRPFEPQSGETYLRETWIPNQSRRISVGSDEAHDVIGLYQVDVVFPSDSGETKHVRTAGEIASHFVVDLELIAEDVTTRVDKRPDIGPTMVEDARGMVPVSISWRSFA